LARRNPSLRTILAKLTGKKPSGSAKLTAAARAVYLARVRRAKAGADEGPDPWRGVRARGNPYRGLPVIYPRLMSIRARETRKGGKNKPPALYEHKFSARVPVLGLPDGSIIIPAPRGRRLWGTVR
jgi:hypothetical protein